ncbi:hypothetical protein GGR92_000916 [Spirosoma lacussanchae]|uniref:DUF5683 domain-containing protein n=1 Tax=Spirosoma lacussanchae TaxID=1884249 RepID=UPI001108516F|nr:DUF5683 domain-containing protein [Spirosoma lacussanchae]
MKQLIVLFVAVLLFNVPVQRLFAQQPAIVPARTPAAVDSTRQIRSAADTIPATLPNNGGRPIRVGSSELTPEGDSLVQSLADTIRVGARQQAEIRKIIPRQATIRSLILPGLGQAYNRQYYKIPFIYGGYAAISYYFLRYRRLANEAEDGYRLLLYGRQIVGPTQVELTNVPQLISQRIPVPAVIEKVEEVQIGDNIFRSTAGAKNAYDFYRRYRDLNILLSIVLYAVSAVEANVAAHLKTFDLSDDISMRVEPTVLPLPGTGPVPGIRLALTFK